MVMAYSSKPRELAKEDIHNGVCTEVFDLGMQEVQFGNDEPKKQHKAIIAFQVEEKDSEGNRKELRKKVTVSLHKKAKLHELLSKWLGEDYLAKYGKGGGVDLARVLTGRSARLVVGIFTAPDGQQFNTVDGVLKPTVDLAVADYTPLEERGDYFTNLRDGVANDNRPPAQKAAGAEDDDIPF